MTLFDSPELERAAAQLPPELKETPLSRGRTQGLSLKLETLQPTGSYKIRAAYLRLLACQEEARSRGAALSSSGNFAGAFTWAAHRLGIPAHLVFTPTVAGVKVRMAQQYPCTIHRCENRYEARFETLQELADQGIHTIDHRADRTVFLGHATIGWEAGQQGGFERVLVPASTGGLALGVASGLRAAGFKGEIVGVQPSGNPTLYRSWRAGHPIQLKSINTICDALTATSMAEDTFAHLQAHLDDVLLVKEDSVKSAVAHLAKEEGLVVEPGGAVGMAAVLEGQRPSKGSLLILSGRNIEPSQLAEYLCG